LVFGLAKEQLVVEDLVCVLRHGVLLIARDGSAAAQPGPQPASGLRGG